MKTKPLNYEIVEASSSDIADIYALERACFSSPWPLSLLYEDITVNGHIYLIIKSEGTTVGYGGMWMILDEAHINNICVLPAYRGRGFGRALLEGLCGVALQNGALSMTLEVRASNSPAIELYNSMGFKLEGVRKGYYSDTREDAHIMWKQFLKKR